MTISFTKMQALGNDFVLFDCREQVFSFSSAFIQQVADRHRGVGCDQILVIHSCVQEGWYPVQIFNADGSEVGQCGNGLRCVVRYLLDHDHVQVKVHLRTSTTTVTGWKTEQNHIALLMGHYDLSKIQPLQCVLQGEILQGYALDIGNPHLVFCVSDVDSVDLVALAELLPQLTDIFPAGANIECMQKERKKQIRIRILERGVGETFACGSGACASAMVAQYSQNEQSPYTVKMPGGDVVVHWDGVTNCDLILRGPAQYVFTGSLIFEKEGEM